MNCKDCGTDLGERSKDVWTKKFLDSELCLGCFRIWESEQDPKITSRLNMQEYKKDREIRRKENGYKS